MKRYLLFAIAFFATTLIACKKDGDEYTQSFHHDVTSVTGPTTVSVNTAVTLTVTYPYSNGCDYVERFEETKDGKTITLKAMSKPVLVNTVCTQDVGTRTIEYKFTPSSTGVYELKFLKTNGTFVTHNVTVQ